MMKEEQTTIPPRLEIRFMAGLDEVDQTMNIPIDTLEPEEIKSLVASTLDLMLANYIKIK